MSCIRLKLVSLLLVSISLSSCYRISYFIFKEKGQIYETQDGILKTIPSLEVSRFYAIYNVDGKKDVLLYLKSVHSNYEYFTEEKLFGKYSAKARVELHRTLFNKNKVGIFFSAGYYYTSTDGYEQTGYIRNATDEELDAKYYASSSFVSEDNEFKLTNIPPMFGYYYDYNANIVDGAYYFGESSIFNFKLHGQYNGVDFTFYFRENKKFLITSDTELTSSGTYSSTLDGMILHFENDNLLGIGLHDIKLSEYFDQEIEGEYSHTEFDLTKYYQMYHPLSE